MRVCILKPNMMKEHQTNAMTDCKRCKEEKKKDKFDREVFLNTFD